MLVLGPSAPAAASLDGLSGREISVRRTSSYFEHLIALNERLKMAGKPEILVKPIDENLEDEDLMEMVAAGLLPCDWENSLSQFLFHYRSLNWYRDDATHMMRV